MKVAIYSRVVNPDQQADVQELLLSLPGTISKQSSTSLSLKRSGLVSNM